MTVLLEYLDCTFSIIYEVAFYFITHWTLFPFSFSFIQSSLRWILNNHNNFQLISLCGLFDRGWNLWFSVTRKQIVQFSPRLGLASYLCCLFLHSFLTTKRYLSDVEPSYIPIFRLIHSAVYPVGVSKNCSCFMQMIDYNSKDLVWILSKLGTVNCLWMSYKWTKFQRDRSTSLRVTAIFFKCVKRQRKKSQEKNFKSLLTHILETLYTIFFKFGV